MVNEINENIFLVNAPAGSGKTTTIRKMVDKHLRTYKEDNILCITYPKSRIMYTQIIS